MTDGARAPLTIGPATVGTWLALPRGGYYVRTSAGPLQIGIPPETIKDVMELKLDVPVAYVLPRDLFDRRRGLSVAEFEFPAYYSFFLLKRRCRLVVLEPRRRAPGPRDLPGVALRADGRAAGERVRGRLPRGAPPALPAGERVLPYRPRARPHRGRRPRRVRARRREGGRRATGRDRAGGRSSSTRATRSSCATTARTSPSVGATVSLPSRTATTDPGREPRLVDALRRSA